MKDRALDADERTSGSGSGHTDSPRGAARRAARASWRRRERRRFAIAVLATAAATPLLLVEVAPRAGASPDDVPAALVAEVVEVVTDPAVETLAEALAADLETPPAKALGDHAALDDDASWRLATFAGGDALRSATTDPGATDADDEADEPAVSDATDAAASEQAARAVEAPPPAPPPTAPPPTTVPPPPPPAPEPAIAAVGGPTAEQWAALRRCESGGNYSAVNPRGYYGAYQFHTSTWDALASRHASHLVGVRPDQAAPADQDAMARALYAERGTSPWPHCGSTLR